MLNLFLIFIRSLFRSSINNPLLISLSGNRDPHFDPIPRSKSRKDRISKDRTSKDRISKDRISEVQILEVRISEVQTPKLKRWTIAYSKEKLPCFIKSRKKNDNAKTDQLKTFVSSCVVTSNQERRKV